MIKGKDLTIKVGDKVIAGARECTLSLTHSVVQVIPEENWQWEEFIAGKCGWDVSTSGLFVETVPSSKASPLDIMRALAGEVELKFVTKFGTFIEGKAFVTNVQAGATVGSLATWAVTFKGSGPANSNNWTHNELTGQKIHEEETEGGGGTGTGSGGGPAL